MNKQEISVRDEEIIRRGLGGEHPRDLADDYGITPTRVYQIFSKNGIDINKILVDKRLKKIEEEKRRSDFKKYGCTKEKRDRIQKRWWNKDNWWATPYGVFLRQKQNAKSRDIEWRISFYDWWEIWELSGKWHKRGRGHGKYCMARMFDSGPYEEGNVHIIPSDQNNREWAYTLNSGVRRCDIEGSHMTERDHEYIRQLKKILP